MQEPNSKTVITADLVTADDNDTRLRILYLYQLRHRSKWFGKMLHLNIQMGLKVIYQ